MIQIKLNGENKSLDNTIKLNDFVISQLSGKEPNGIAVALNDRVIPKQKWESVLIKENDTIEIIHAVQGG
jgi:sulfur carrier protein